MSRLACGKLNEWPPRCVFPIWTDAWTKALSNFKPIYLWTNSKLISDPPFHPCVFAFGRWRSCTSCPTGPWQARKSNFDCGLDFKFSMTGCVGWKRLAGVLAGLRPSRKAAKLLKKAGLDTAYLFKIQKFTDISIVFSDGSGGLPGTACGGPAC